MQAVEQKVRGAADAGRPRAAAENPMVTSMRAAVTKAEEQLAKAEAAARAAYVEASAALSARRKAAAGKLETAVMRELKPLKLDKAKFAVALTPVAVEQGTAAGLDAVEFQIATNPGVAAGALTKIASGGELARVILALKVALAERGTAPTLIFDEVDQGVGGVVRHIEQP